MAGRIGLYKAAIRETGTQKPGRPLERPGFLFDFRCYAKKAKRTTKSAATICVAGCRTDQRPVQTFKTT